RTAWTVCNSKGRCLLDDSGGVFICKNLTSCFDLFVDRDNPEKRGCLHCRQCSRDLRVFLFHILPPEINQHWWRFDPEGRRVMELYYISWHTIGGFSFLDGFKDQTLME